MRGTHPTALSFGRAKDKFVGNEFGQPKAARSAKARDGLRPKSLTHSTPLWGEIKTYDRRSKTVYPLSSFRGEGDMNLSRLEGGHFDGEWQCGRLVDGSAALDPPYRPCGRDEYRGTRKVTSYPRFSVRGTHLPHFALDRRTGNGVTGEKMFRRPEREWYCAYG